MCLGLVTYICNSSAQEAEEEGLQIQGWHELHSKCQANLEYTERPCTSYFFLCCHKISDKSSLWKEGFILVHI